jgi:hypothetical protein
LFDQPVHAVPLRPPGAVTRRKTEYPQVRRRLQRGRCLCAIRTRPATSGRPDYHPDRQQKQHCPRPARSRCARRKCAEVKIVGPGRASSCARQLDDNTEPRCVMPTAAFLALSTLQMLFTRSWYRSGECRHRGPHCPAR